MFDFVYIFPGILSLLKSLILCDSSSLFSISKLLLSTYQLMLCVALGL